MSPLLKAIGVGIGVFLLMLLALWGIARLAGQPFFLLPAAPKPTPIVEQPSPRTLPFR